MAWFWLAFAAQVLFSAGAHVDKHLLSRYFEGAAPGSLILFSTVFGFVVMPIAYALDPAAFHLPPLDAAKVVGGGLLNITAIVLYLYALARDEASVVTPLFQLIPVFSYGSAYVLLGEALTGRQIVGGALVLVGAVFVTVDLDAKRFKGIVFVLMAIASLFLALNAVVFKGVALADRFWVATFWSYASLALAGVILFAFVRPYRRQFLHTLRVNRGPVIALNAFNETIAVVGYLMISYASLLAPVALVAVVGGFQPLLVFLMGWALTRLFPTLARERLTKRQVVQKVVAILLVAGGAVLLHLG